MKILVLGGGDSPEREVSIRSAKSVAEAARHAGFEVEEYDPIGGFAVLDKITKNIVALPILHGINGEDGVIQAELEKRQLPFLGADSNSSAACFDKWQTRQKLEAAGVPMPKAVKVTKDSYHSQDLAQKPHVLKVLHGGSSIGTLIVRDPKNLKPEEIDKLFNLEEEAVLEELVEGTEVTVPILDKSALPIIEIVPPEGLEFDFENKYNGLTAEICPPKTVSEELQKKAQKLAEQVHEIMDCRHLSRTDIMIDKAGNLYVLEINTIPGLTDQSLYPKSAKVSGMDVPALITKFVELVKRDYNL